MYYSIKKITDEYEAVLHPCVKRFETAQDILKRMSVYFSNQGEDICLYVWSLSTKNAVYRIEENNDN